MTKITSIDKEGKKVYWTVEREELGEVSVNRYMTNDEGCGMFVADDYYQQIEGTAQFSLTQKSISGIRKALAKKFA